MMTKAEYYQTHHTDKGFIHLVHSELTENHARRGVPALGISNAYAVVYIMERDGQYDIAWFSDGFEARLPDWEPRLWGSDTNPDNSVADTAQYLLGLGWFPQATELLEKIANQ